MQLLISYIENKIYSKRFYLRILIDIAVQVIVNSFSNNSI